MDVLIKWGQRLYIVQAALEYLVAIMVSGSFLATLTKELGFSDSLTGILSAVISLGCLFQLLSMSLRPRRVKPLVITLSVLNQVLFMLLYVVPLAGVSKSVKTVLAVVFIVAAYFLYYLAHPPKTGWLMSMVEDDRRGIFTANKEIVSLLAGMVFSFLMGTLSDRFAEAGDLHTAFILTALVLTAGYLCAAFAVPSNGLVMFLLYYVFYGVAMGGINSALTNMVFDYVPHEKRADSLAVCQAASGTVGFLVTLGVSPLVTLIQENGNRVLGIPLYAQQVVTVLGLLFTVVTIVYVRCALINKIKETSI